MSNISINDSNGTYSLDIYVTFLHLYICLDLRLGFLRLRTLKNILTCSDLTTGN